MKLGQKFVATAALCAGITAFAAPLNYGGVATDLSLDPASGESPLLQKVLLNGYGAGSPNGWFFSADGLEASKVTYPTADDVADATEVANEALKLETSGGYVGLDVAVAQGAPDVSTGQAAEFTVDVSLSAMTDTDSVDVAAIQAKGPKAAVFAVVDPTDESRARIAAISAGAMTPSTESESGYNEFAAGEILYLYDQVQGAFVTIPATGATNTVAVRVQNIPWGELDSFMELTTGVQIFSVAIDGNDNYVWATADGTLKGYAPTATSDATLFVTDSVGPWAVSPRFLGNEEDICNRGSDEIKSVMFQGSSDYMANLTLDLIDMGGVTPSYNWVLSMPVGTVEDADGAMLENGAALEPGATYTVVDQQGYIFVSITGCDAVSGKSFTVPEQNPLEADAFITVTLKETTAAIAASDIANIPESQLSADAAAKITAAIGENTAGFDTWATDKGVSVESVTTASADGVINGFLTNLSVDEAATEGLLDAVELAFNDDGTVGLVVNGVAGTATIDPSAINGRFVIYSGANVTTMTESTVEADMISSDSTGKITLKAMLPEAEAFFYKAGIVAK